MKIGFGLALVSASAVLGTVSHLVFRRAVAMEQPLVLVASRVSTQELRRISHALVEGGGPWTLVEFMDYECPPCRLLAVDLEKPGVLPAGVELRVAPYPLIDHPSAFPLAVEAERNARAGRFAEAHRRLIRSDPVATASHAPDTAAERRVRAALEVGGRAGVEGTPTMFLAHSSGRVFRLSSTQRLANAVRRAEDLLRSP